MSEIMFVNPRKRRSSKRASPAQAAWRKKFGQMFGGGKRRGRKRRASPRRRKNPMRSVVSAVGKPVSAKRWRSSGFRRNPSHRRRRNPNGFRAGRRAPTLRPTLQSVLDNVTYAAQGAVGSTLVDIAFGQLISRQIIPVAMLSPQLYPVIKAGTAIGLGLLVQSLPMPKQFRAWGAEMAKGSLTVTLANVLRTFIPTMFPTALPLGAYPSSGMVLRNGNGRVGEYLGQGREVPMWERELFNYGPAYAASGIGESRPRYMGEYLQR